MEGGSAYETKDAQERLSDVGKDQISLERRERR